MSDSYYDGYYGNTPPLGKSAYDMERFQLGVDARKKTDQSPTPLTGLVSAPTPTTYNRPPEYPQQESNESNRFHTNNTSDDIFRTAYLIVLSAMVILLFILLIAR